MAVYFITGKLGSGKTLSMVGRIKDYLIQGRRVATNLDLKTDELLAPWRKNVDLIRLPDQPTTDDLNAIGRGDGASYDESRFGALVFDECALWLNTRSWSADKSRSSLIAWLVHARKKGWDVFFIIQDLDAVDKQIRDMFCEHLVVCERLDRMSFSILKALPVVLFIAAGLAMAIGIKQAIALLVFLFCISVPFGSRVPLPKIHRAKVYYGDSVTSPLVDTWIYKSSDLYGSYDTRQRFFERDSPLSTGLSSMLSPWYLVGRYTGAKEPSLFKHSKKLLYGYNALFFIGGFSVLFYSFDISSSETGVGSFFNRHFSDSKNPTTTSIHKQESTALSPDFGDNYFSDVFIVGSLSYESGSYSYFFEKAGNPYNPAFRVFAIGECSAYFSLGGGKVQKIGCKPIEATGGPLPSPTEDAQPVNAIASVDPPTISP